MSSLSDAIAVLCGGAAGAVCRFTLNDGIMAAVGPGFPYGILCINIAGGLAMGLLQGFIARRGTPFAALYSLLGTGFLGGFTTFSTFSMDTFTLYAAGRPYAAAVNVLSNALLCIAAAGIGYILTGARVARTRERSTSRPSALR